MYCGSTLVASSEKLLVQLSMGIVGLVKSVAYPRFSM
jgi:hypothetical protein